jgi:hypothetical protein
MCLNAACGAVERSLTFESMLTDPIIRLVMASDGVGPSEFVAAMEVARAAVVARELQAVQRSGMARPAA